MEHDDLISMARQFGYKSISKGGLCHGFSSMWVQAICSGNLEAFNNRLKTLERYAASPAQLEAEINKLRNLVRKGIPLNDSQKKLLEIPAFFEGVALYYDPRIGFEMFGRKAVEQYDQIQVSAYVQSQHLEKMGGLSLVLRTADQYDKARLTHFLTIMNYKLQSQPNVAIILESERHSVAIRVVGKNQFELIDTNNLDEAGKRYTSKELAKKLDFSFKNGRSGVKPLLITTSIFTNKNNPLQLRGLVAKDPLSKLEVNANGYNLLYHAALLPNTDVLERMDFKKIDINQYVYEKNSILTMACVLGNKVIVDYLLGLPTINVTGVDNSSLNGAILNNLINNEVDLVEKILKHRSFDPSKKSPDGNALHFLSAVGQYAGTILSSIAKKLLKRGMDIHAKDCRGDTPLHQACSQGNLLLTKLFLEHGANTAAVNKKGLTPLMTACVNNKPSLVPLLLRRTPVTMNDIKANSPLLKLIPHCNLKTQNYFLKKALDYYIKVRAAAKKKYLNPLNLGFSKEEKIQAATALLKALNGDKTIDLKPHYPALSDGRLAALYAVYKKMPLANHWANKNRLFNAGEIKSGHEDKVVKDLEHEDLISIAHHLGYKSIRKEGLCHGFSSMWAQAICSDNLPAFNNRLKILERYASSPAQLAAEIKELRNLARKGVPLNASQKEVLEIPAFFEGVALYLAPIIGLEMSGGKVLYQKDETQVSTYVQSEHLEEAGGLSLAFRTADQYDHPRLIHFLEKINHQLQSQPNVAITLGAENHSVAIRVVGKNQFELIDSNHLDEVQQRYTSSELAEKLDFSFENLPSGVKPLMIMTSIFTSKKNPLKLRRLAVKDPLSELGVSRQGATLLCHAAVLPNVEVLKRMDFSKIDINQLSYTGKSALSTACAMGNKVVVDYLLNLPSIDVSRNDDKSLKAAINYDLLNNKLEMVEKIVEHRSFDPRKKSPDGNALHCLPAIGQYAAETLSSIVKKLIEQGVDVNSVDSRGCTPLHQACSQGNWTLTKLFLENGADTAAVNKKGLTPLMTACVDNKLRLIPLLLRGTQLSMKDIKANSPLLKLISCCSVETQSEFLKKALNCYIKARKVEGKKYLNPLNFGFSKEEKIQAATALLEVINGDKTIDLKSRHSVLSNGRLAVLYAVYKKMLLANKNQLPNAAKPGQKDKEVEDQLTPNTSNGKTI